MPEPVSPAGGSIAGPILITGGAGFVGQHLVTALRAAFPDVELVTPESDVRDAPAVAAMIGAVQPACCVHLAAIASVPQAAAAQGEAWQVNLLGTLNVAQAVLAHAPTCLLLAVASADAYGASFRAGAALDESAVLAPMNIYGATKAAADLAVGALVEQGLRAVRLRPFNHIGAGQSADFVVASFARQIARIEAGLQEPVLSTGRLDTSRDFLDVRDVCAAYVACIARHHVLAPGSIFNIASGRPRRIGDVLDELLALAGLGGIEVRAAAPRMRQGDIPTAIGNAAQAARVLGWAPSIAWADTLAWVLKDWRQRTAPSNR